jgi:hypothetical protein
MIVSLRGRLQAVSPRKLLTAAGIVLAGLVVSFAALTHEGGPAAFFNLEPTLSAAAQAAGFDGPEAELIAARGTTREFVTQKDPWKESNFWSNWYYTVPTVILGLIGAALAIFTAM